MKQSILILALLLGPTASALAQVQGGTIGGSVTMNKVACCQE